MRVQIGAIGRVLAGFLGLLLVTASLFLLSADLISTLQSGGILVVRSLADIWMPFDATGPAAAADWVGQHFPAGQGLLNVVLNLYGWLVSGLAGVLLIFFFGPRRPD